MNIAFINYGGFASINSASQIFSLANELVRRGHDCLVAVPENPDDVGLVGKPEFRPVGYAELVRRKDLFANLRGPDLIHCWTPREIVRRCTAMIRQNLSCPYVVHLEDNEDLLAADALGIDVDTLLTLPPEELDNRIPLERSHPSRMRRFLEDAAGTTAIVESLLQWAPPNKPSEVIWPGADGGYLSMTTRDDEFRELFGIAPDDTVITYPGNSHGANRGEVRSLYLAVALLNQRGRRCWLLRLGGDHCNLLGHEWEVVRPFCIEFGARGREAVLRPTAAADLLVQPGRPGRFNNFRLPSKLPDFLASGRPVFLPRANLGLVLRDHEECVLLERGDSLDIAEKVEALIGDPDLSHRIGMGGRAFARRNLSWEQSAKKLEEFYTQVVHAVNPETWVGRAVQRAPRWRRIQPDDLDRAVRRYCTNFTVPAFSYSTVQDFCDSFDYLHAIATENRDMKDCQRPWTMKAILGMIPPGGRVLEIGAGEPIVAELLSCTGYEVWIVDPYDGSGNGPIEYEQFRRDYPEIRIIRGRFGSDITGLNEHSFDCVYSISVLEHLPATDLEDVFSGIRRLLVPSGYSIHSVDYIVRGQGAEFDRRNLGELVRLSGHPIAELQRITDILEADTDTYFLSAEGHNLWRGKTPYGRFPMRRVTSLQICTPHSNLAAAGAAKRQAHCIS